MERRTLLLISLCIGVLVVTSAVAADQPALELALRTIKMTERDLSFSKTNVESELVLAKARTFLQQPLALPVYSTQVMTGLSAIISMAGLAEFADDQLELTPPPPVLVPRPPVFIDGGFLSKLPTSMTGVVQRIVQSVNEVGYYLGTPRNRAAAFAAISISTFQLDKDKAEVDRWAQDGMDMTKLRELLRRDENLELQDTELADAVLATSDNFSPATMMVAFKALARAVDDAIAELRPNQFTEEFQAETDTPLGKIICGGIGRNVYTNEALLIIDTGGDDVYENSAGGANGLVGRPVSIVIDLAGNDQYISRRSFSQGSGLFGIGILADYGGGDVYEAKHLSQGAGFFGYGLLADFGGRDKFKADTFAQGAAAFGAGILWQRAGHTEYRAAQMAQGFGGTQGIGLLLDVGGNDSYIDGGKYPCDWLPGHKFSLSQGFGYGTRPFAGGGVGILCDLKGDDRYVTDVYGQGASYWYSVGLLLDAEGNDTYEAHQYCQGAGIHLSSGALIDWAGNDTYTAGHICQGAAHDYSVGMLIDYAGNDKYTGDTTAQGSAINNSFAMLLDVAGDDSYTGTDPKQSQAAGHDGDKREYGSIALMLDLAGKDTYSQGQSNDAVWLKPLYGAGLDAEITWQAASLPLPATMAGEPPALQSGKRLFAVAPVDPHHPTEHLLRVAISDQPDAGKAWDELKHQGTNALPYLLTRLDSPNVLVRAKTEELIDHLGTNSIPALIAGIDHAANDEIARLCCYFLARFDEKARPAIPHVMPLLNRDLTRPVAFYTLGHLRAREVFAPAMKVQPNERELIRLRATQALGRLDDKRATVKLIAALDDEIYDVRYAAEDALVGFGKSSIGPLRNAYAKASSRARPHIIEALARLKDSRALKLAEEEYRHDDQMVREAVMQSLRAALAGAKSAVPPPKR